MFGSPTDSQADSSRSVLEFIHSLLASSEGERATLDELLSGLTAAFGVDSAGLATLPEGIPLTIHPATPHSSATECLTLWRDNHDLIERVHRAGRALAAPRSGGGSYLLTLLGAPERGGWLLWLEDPNRAGWSDGEAAALTLAGHALSHRLAGEDAPPRWAEQLDRGIRQQRLEAAARLVRRLAHDFGNILTGILGFSELALSQQLSSGTPLHAYLTEVYRGAQNGAEYTNQLRLFARRQTTGNRSCSLAPAVAEEEKRLRPGLRPDVALTVDLPAELPPVGLEGEHLRQVLAILLDNAREAITGGGAIHISAHLREVSAAEARELFGDVRPGASVEVCVADTGSGLTPEARRQLFTEPFFSTKPRQRGFSLAIAYGILAAHRAGIGLVPRAEGGTLARIVLPVAAIAAPMIPAPKSAAVPPSPQPTPPSNEKVLVVDDDPMILQFVTTTLQRAGFRVSAVANAEDALRSYTGAAADPFRLVLTDVLMPNLNGIDLARRLLDLDADVRVLFMSGQVPAEITQQAFAPRQFELVPKPFRPEGLVRAVRTALDRAAPRRATVEMTR